MPMTNAEIIDGLKAIADTGVQYGLDRKVIEAAIHALTVDEAKVAEIRARHERVERNMQSEWAKGNICRPTRLHKDRAALLAMVRK